MAEQTQIFRVRDLAFEIKEQNAFVRELVAEALKILSKPVPDTFLGRKTQEPFPISWDG